jgi:methylmalonyl-CoA/ethylmalonyl-CoA epimerase
MMDTLENHLVCQVGLVVRDVEASAQAFADLFGVETPSWKMTDPLEAAHTLYKGEPTEARAKLAFLDAGAVAIELIEPVGGPSTWRDFLDEHGEGVHHIAFRIEEMDGQVATLAEKGMPAVQTGDYTGGCYAYIDSAPQLGVILELLAKR